MFVYLVLTLCLHIHICMCKCVNNCTSMHVCVVHSLPPSINIYHSEWWGVTTKEIYSLKCHLTHWNNSKLILNMTFAVARSLEQLNQSHRGHCNRTRHSLHSFHLHDWSKLSPLEVIACKMLLTLCQLNLNFKVLLQPHVEIM